MPGGRADATVSRSWAQHRGQEKGHGPSSAQRQMGRLGRGNTPARKKGGDQNLSLGVDGMTMESLAQGLAHSASSNRWQESMSWGWGRRADHSSCWPTVEPLWLARRGSSLALDRTAAAAHASHRGPAAAQLGGRVAGRPLGGLSVSKDLCTKPAGTGPCHLTPSAPTQHR